MAGRELTITPTKRERRKSPGMVVGFTPGTVEPPISPTSSVADTTFEPTIDMMVNDFDDEATLNEEEALADLEAHSAEDEIATLREESEMPIEELLAKYSSMTGSSHLGAGLGSSKRSSSGLGSSSRRRRANKRQCQETEPETVARPSSTCAIGSADPSEPEQKSEQEDYCTPISSAQCSEAGMDADEVSNVLPPELNKPKSHRSHLLDLYPEQSFTNSAPEVVDLLEDEESFTPLQTLFEQVEAEAEEEDSDTDSDDVRKIIMVGPDYQAEIPEGLSQYGDILPYENEDQLIWEPSQVTEREVEDYLAKIQEARSWTTATGEDGVLPEGDVEVQEEKIPTSSPEDTPAVVTTPSEAITTTPQAPATVAGPALNQDLDAVVKDNEQALHLLVQCGYDFKEALRRKRLNVLPLSDTMSSWSEEECEKFEEGIQKFGKDFYQIRQNQVRTRTMRELVQFYYLWKKSERRDQCFALNDTIDHMDVFINEGEERAGNGMGNGLLMATGNGNGNGNGSGNEHGNGNGNGSCSSHSSGSGGSQSNGHSNGAELAEKEKDNRKASTKNYSIMTGSQLGAAGTSNGNGTAVAAPSSGTSRKRGASLALEEHEDREQEAVNEVDNLS